MTPQFGAVPISVRLAGAAKRHNAAVGYGDDIRALLDRVWKAIRDHKTPHSGIHHVVYGEGDEVFACVVLAGTDGAPIGLEERTITIERYAYYKHIGPYSKLGRVNQPIRAAIAQAGRRVRPPMVEVNGHRTADESKIETELILALAD